LLFNSGCKKEGRKKYDIQAFYSTMSFTYMNLEGDWLQRGVVYGTETNGLGWKTVGALICLRIRDNVRVYGRKEGREGESRNVFHVFVLKGETLIVNYSSVTIFKNGRGKKICNKKI